MLRSRKFWAGLLAVGLVAAACGGDDDAEEGASTTAAGAEGGGAVDLKGKTVKIFSSIRDIEAERLEAAWAPFEAKTGVDIVHEPSAEFETQLRVLVEGGNAPDIAFIPQPGLLATLAKDGKVTALPDLKSYVEENHIAGWTELGTVDGKFYAPPFGANIKSLVWYNPKKFAEKKYEIPETWADLLALSDKIVADGGKPWCAGIESGGATGWPATDWMEDIMLRVQGPEVYDQWVSHEIPFNDPKVVAVADEVGKVLRNEKYIKGGVKSIATTSFQEGGLGVLDGSCYMHRQASFYGNQFPEGTAKGPDGDVNAFYLPVAKAGDPKVMLGGGELIAAFSDKPEVAEVVKYLTGAEYANERAKAGNWLSPNKGLDPKVITDPLEKNFAELLQSSDVFRFDASDLMPAEVGAGTFWTEMTAWIGTGKDTKAVLDAIEKSWPK
jgi:alpha-glucoside transport system substrate-binding protein